MMRWLPLVFLLLAPAALAGDPDTWAGVRIDAPATLGLGKITPIVGEDAWQGALADGAGFVRVWVAPDAAVAREVFAFQRQSAATVPMADLARPGWDEAAGDGAALALVRVGNVVIFARDHGEHATARVETLVKALVHTVPPTSIVTDRAGIPRDATGRQLR